MLERARQVQRHVVSLLDAAAAESAFEVVSLLAGKDPRAPGDFDAVGRMSADAHLCCAAGQTRAVPSVGGTFSTYCFCCPRLNVISNQHFWKFRLLDSCFD